MRDVITFASPTSPEINPMLLVDCPLCDGPAPFETATGTLDCPACAVRLELAPDERLELATAA